MNNYNIDSEGFLLDFDTWDNNFRDITADTEQIILTEEHIFIIEFLRDFYKNNQKSPAIRALVSSLKQKYGQEIGSSIHLQMLFPSSPAVQSAKIAGLPKPKRCI